MLLKNKVSKYMSTARVVAISKDKNGSAYPILGEVRTISILPAISKLLEDCLLQLV
jgi:hypothetical protein